MGGSIPARAGEPGQRGPRHHRAGVYPRACGGTTHVPHTPAPGIGLSPRVRGNQREKRYQEAKRRSIPARAGEPTREAIPGGQAKVYPRACGGTPMGQYPDVSDTGLSPRVRGNRQTVLRFKESPRSIPARAGEPWPPVLPCCLSPVYPRACGGTLDKRGKRGNVDGLSPRVRGNHRQASPLQTRVRSIPARAGEPTANSSPTDNDWVYPRACGGTDCKLIANRQ